MEKPLKNKQKQLKSGEEQVEAINEHGKEIVKSDKDVDEHVQKNNKPYEKLEDKIFDELPYERISEARDLGRQINFNNLTCYFNSKGNSPINFIGFNGPLHLYQNIFNVDTNIEKAEEDQKEN